MEPETVVDLGKSPVINDAAMTGDFSNQFNSACYQDQKVTFGSCINVTAPSTNTHSRLHS